MSTEEKPGRMPIPPGVRARLQKLFEFGTSKARAGEFDYANDMYTQCLHGDPGNPIYVKAFLDNLSKKYGNNKKGAKLAGLTTVGSKASLKTAVARKKWDDVVKIGLEILKSNPWDTGVLADVGRAVGEMDYDEGEVEFLKQAIDADSEDPETNRMLGRAYERVGQFIPAVECFTRVLRAKPKDEEALRAMSNLAVKRTIEKGGYEDAKTAQDVRAAKRGASLDDDEETALSPEEKLLRAIEKDATDKEAYLELNDLYVKEEVFDKGVELMKKAMDALGGGDIMLRERFDDNQLRYARQQLTIAEQKLAAEKTPEAEQLYKRVKAELNSKETEIYAKRCERYPTNLGFKYELAVRLQRAGKFQEAIKLFQDARSDLKRKGLVLMALGDCFYSIKQYRLALQHYEQAESEISDRDPDMHKGVIYKAGRLAEFLKEWDAAEKHYNLLAAIDFSFKDVSERLDKILRIRENGGDPDLQ
jgi:tetratricopeptide (TPR) repeat protein